MSYHLAIAQGLDKIFFKLSKKNPKQLYIIDSKVKEILDNPHHYKPLRGDMHGARRVHIDRHFVLTFDIDESTKTIKLLDFRHHDFVYK